jgi:hypothetical protein
MNHFLINLLRIKDLYMFRALPAHLQKAPYKQHLAGAKLLLYHKPPPVLGNILLLFCPCLLQFLAKNAAPV